jgi:exonuclease III
LDTNQGVHINNLKSLPEEIPTITNYMAHNENLKSKKYANLENLVQISFDHVHMCRGETKIKVCSINPRSLKNKALSISDYIVTNDFDIVAFTETLLGTASDRPVIAELVPNGFKICHVPRNSHGWGVAITYKTSIGLKLLESSRNMLFTTFEYMDCNITIKNYSLRLAVVYRPPRNKQNGLKSSTFLENELPSFLAQLASVDKNIIIVGDLNVHLDYRSSADTAKFTSV